MQRVIPFSLQHAQLTSDDLPIHEISPVCDGSHEPPTSPSIDGHFSQQRMGKRTFDQGQQSATAENQRHCKYSRIVAPRDFEDPLLNRVSDLSVSRELTVPNAPGELVKHQAIMDWLDQTTIEVEVKRFIALTYTDTHRQHYINVLNDVFASWEGLHDVGVSASLMKLSCTDLKQSYPNVSYNCRAPTLSPRLVCKFICHLSHVSERLIHQQSDTWKLESEPMKTFFAKHPDLGRGALTASEWTAFANRLHNVSKVSYWIAQTILHGAQSIYEGVRNSDYALPQLYVQLPIRALCNAQIDQISWKDKTIAIDRSTVVHCKPDFMERLATYINDRKNGYIFYDTQSKQHIGSPSKLQKDLAVASRRSINKVNYLTLLQTAIAFADNEGSDDELKKSDWLDGTTLDTALNQFAHIPTGYLIVKDLIAKGRAILKILAASNTPVSASMSLRAFAHVDLGTLMQLINTSRYAPSTRRPYLFMFKAFIRYLSQVSMGLIHEVSPSWNRNSRWMRPILSKARKMIYPLQDTDWKQFAEALEKDSVCPSYYLIACTILYGARAIYEDYRQCSARPSESWDLPYLVDNFSLNKVLTAQIDGISFDKETITFDEHTVARFPASFMKKIQDYTKHRTGRFIFIDTEGNPIQAQGVHKAFKEASKGIYENKTVTHLTLLETAIIVSDSEKDGTRLPLFDSNFSQDHLDSADKMEDGRER